jgi:ATP-dependent DNA helicase RecQ
LKEFSNVGWQKIRQLVLWRDNFHCFECNEDLKNTEAHIHHVIPRYLGGNDHITNLVTLCPGCHGGKHALFQISLSRRYLEKWSWKLSKLINKDFSDIENGETLGTGLRLLGAKNFREGQLEVVMSALAGKSVLLISPTGSGKSICFQLPGLLKDGINFVMVPLKTLMMDQVLSLHKKRIPSTFINSDLDLDEKKKRYLICERGAIKFLYLAPEQLDENMSNINNVKRLKMLKPTYLIIDEAHCVDKWGKDFRPSYAKIGLLRKELGNPPVLAFTATATQSTQRRILEALEIPDATIFMRDINRKEIALARCYIEKETQKIDIIEQAINRRLEGKILIFVPSLKIGNYLSYQLKLRNIDVPFFHGRLNKHQKQTIFDGVLGINMPRISVVICTNAFGMGLDIHDIRLVIHWQHPANIEDYVQEIGRAGRDGHQSAALLLVGVDDLKLQTFMIENTLRDATLKGIINETSALNEKFIKMQALKEINIISNFSNNCFRKSLLRPFGETISKSKFSFSKWLLSLVFEKKDNVIDTEFCCYDCAKLKKSQDYFKSPVDWIFTCLVWNK